MIIVSLLIWSSQSYGQEFSCAKWGTGQDSIRAIENHVLYRDYLKNKNYKEAFPFWEKVYATSPSGSVRHFQDGVTMYKTFINETTDSATQADYGQKLLSLYDHRIQCFGKEGYVLGRKTVDMFYTVRSADTDVYQTAARSVELQGKQTASSILYPYAATGVRLYQKGEVDSAEIRSVYLNLLEIADHNIQNAKDEKTTDRYQRSKESVQQLFNPIVTEVLTCADVMNREMANYSTTLYDRTLRLKMLKLLQDVACTGEEELPQLLVAREREYQDSVKVANMTYKDWGDAKYREGLYDEAIAYYDTAIVKDPVDDRAKAKISQLAAKICYRDLKNKSRARKYARQASRFDANWGEPYLLIGEMYASSGKDCGTGRGWNSQVCVWVAIDKWEKAKQVDKECTSRANKFIREYTKYMPDVEACHARQYKTGDAYTVECWIQETTTVRPYDPFKNNN